MAAAFEYSRSYLNIRAFMGNQICPFHLVRVVSGAKLMPLPSPRADEKLGETRDLAMRAPEQDPTWNHHPTWAASADCQGFLRLSQ
jgi:hypothetical protein